MTPVLEALADLGTLEEGRTRSGHDEARPFRQVPVSSQQRGLWFIQHTNPDCGAYHLVFSAELDASSSMAAGAHAALAALTEEHEALRVSFAATEAGPEQWVWRNVAPSIKVTDSRDLTPDTLREIIRSDTRRPFDMSVPPLWRVHFYRIGESRWVMTCVAHHIALDFWSLGLLLRCFVSRLTGQGATAIDGSAFADHAAEQQALIADEAVTSRWLERWRQCLDGAPATINLPLDKPRPPVVSYRGRSMPFLLSPAASEGIRRVARESGATPFMTILAAYQFLLSRFSGESDVVVGSPTAGRLRRQYRNALGNFVNTVVFRGRIDEDRSFRELLGSARNTVIDCLRSQDCPFPWLVKALAPPRDAGHTPIYQASLAWDRLPLLGEFEAFFLPEPDLAPHSIGGMTLRPYPLPQQEGQVDLALEMGGERDGGYCGTIKYNTDLFHAATIRGLVDSFVALVEQVTANPDAALCAIPTLTTAQHATLRAAGTGPDMVLPPLDTYGIIARQAQRTPLRPAVSDGHVSWTYAELMQATDQIARHLQRLSVTSGDRIGILLERGAPMVAALLSVLRCGATYVPLDPAFPAERLAYMMHDASIHLVLSDRASQPCWPATLPVCCIDDPLPAGPSLPLRSPLKPPCSAYILYTSGSTGRPKGVRISQQALVNLLLAMGQELPMDQRDVLLAVTTIAFDIAALELFLPLTLGAHVVVCDRATASDPAALATRIEQSGATWLQATPSTWSMLLAAGWSGKADLHALCGGEALTTVLAEALLPKTASLRNVYGPTETTIWSTCGEVRPGQPIDLGRPLANTTLYVLDRRQRMVPPGVRGELYIGGQGVARDYWDRPELTNARFLAGLPMAPADRIYRTGDQVRWTSDGRLEHHGRFDDQIKLRGHRIEPGEIEALLRDCPDIRDAVVLVRDDRLVAYLLVAEGNDIDISHPRTVLKQMLPPYMVPSAFVPMTVFPRTLNNKIDRNALPAPGDQPAKSFAAPRDATEITLTGIWSELLNYPGVGIHDNFFEIGGHSLLAVRLVTAIRRRWGVDLPVSRLLQHGTIAELATLLRQDDAAGLPGTLVTLRQGDLTLPPLFLFHPIGGNVFCYLALTRQMTAGRTVLAIQAPGLEAEDETEVSVEDMARRYLREIRRVQPFGPYALGGWCFGGVIAYEAARQLLNAGETIERLVAIDSRAPVALNHPEEADDATLLSWFARDLATPFGKTLTIPADILRQQPNERMLDLVLDEAMRIGVVPEDGDRSLMQRYFEVYMGNGIAMHTYMPEPAPIDLMLLRARDEPADYGPTLGWDALIEGRLSVIEVAGDHNSVMYPPNVDAVAAAIDRQLHAAVNQEAKT